MTTATVLPLPDAAPPRAPRHLAAAHDRGDRIFRTGTLLAGLAVLGIMAGVGAFLGADAWDAIRTSGIHFLTTEAWQPAVGKFGIAAVMTGTVMIAVVAVAVAMPISLGTSLFIAEVAPQRIRTTLIAAVDLMAAVPSVIYGLWGLFLFEGRVIGLSRWLSKWLGWIPVFHVDGADANSPLSSASVYTASTFIAGLVVALMVVPIQTSIMREVFSQVPAGEREGAFALGASRWGMIRIVSLPFGRGGIIGGTMLGLGRALGETIAVLLILSPRFDVNFHVLEAGGNSVSALIASRFGDASDFETSALMAAGLALFALTLVVNFTASTFIARSRSGASSEA